MTARIIVEADGGSRGNPGPAAYGALIRDADTGTVIAERGETIGVATNNVAEYSGLIAGLELAREHAPGAEVEVRMDSKLVIEQMAGRWKIKHADMKSLGAKARTLAPANVVWTWIPRGENSAADALVNAALDGSPAKKTEKNPLVGWKSGLDGAPTTIVLLRHGVTESTDRKLFCGRGGADPGLTKTGEEQAQRAAAWIANHGGADAIIASPLQRTRETAGFVSRELGLDVELEAGIAEAAFGEWDGFSFPEVLERWPSELDEWLSSTAIAPPGGEAFDAVSDRVTAARDRIVAAYPGKTVVAVSHVTPIKMMVRLALDAPMPVIYKMELAPASITTISWWADGTPSLRNFSVVPD